MEFYKYDVTKTSIKFVANLVGQLIASTDGSVSSFDMLGDNVSIEVLLTRPNVVGNKVLKKVSTLVDNTYTISGNVMTMQIGHLHAGAISRVTIIAKVGTYTRMLAVYDLAAAEKLVSGLQTESTPKAVTVSESVGDGGGAGGGGMVETTWADLKVLRDAGELVAGTMYRITDYCATTTTEGSASAEHPFDIIATALTEDTLGEECRAIQHQGDTYFSNCNLAAWKVWYSLDNNADVYTWADEENGTGVVYRIIDEYGNDAPFDFKGIMFTRALDENGELDKDSGTDTLCYLFNFFEAGECHDMTIYTYTETIITCAKNRLDSCVDFEKQGETFSIAYMLPDDVCLCHGDEDGSSCCCGWTCGSNCYGWTCGNNCNSWTCGDYCDSWTCGNSCFGWTCGNSCFGWTCGNNCDSWTCGNNCSEWDKTGVDITEMTIVVNSSKGIVFFNLGDLA